MISFRVCEGLDQRAGPQSVLITRRVPAGAVDSFSGALGGRGVNVPPQFGQRRPGKPSAQSMHQVHSNEQINADASEGDRSRSQHSHPGRISSTADAHPPKNDPQVPYRCTMPTACVHVEMGFKPADALDRCPDGAVHGEVLIRAAQVGDRFPVLGQVARDGGSHRRSRVVVARP